MLKASSCSRSVMAESNESAKAAIKGAHKKIGCQHPRLNHRSINKPDEKGINNLSLKVGRIDPAAC